jgi:hypothetical protein
LLHRVEFSYVQPSARGAGVTQAAKQRQPRCASAETIGVGGRCAGQAAIMIKAATSFIAFLIAAPFGSETINVRGHGAVDLETFECRDITRSSLIQRVCYDHAQHTLIVGIKSRYDQYCDLPQPTFDGFMAAPSMGQFFNQNIGGSGTSRRYDCRTHRDR